ncbi:cytoskeleton protein RodZ [Photobacterium sp. DNB23_23_1]|uniref:Cytoskeleton protein RodZ n=1 Tax=Photobacterium pectinilyticum TaxID=2906793 RepID=A0ABT1MX13_9GAMM|nr:cytoskeleton protein RodZ [Photobacterium sp. ZSDE20]MCQ1057035.1 cytoskeleton protein RodZ [Photobacterium sp. ZSDE20]MDD1821170.1 cytoskeleton protein RodZ [Photobacterium sp. ZSDE20]
MNTEQNEERSTEDIILPGDMLRQAREKLGYSQKDVASRLRLRLSVVSDIEDNHFEEAQLATFTRGYVRSYAKFVGLDEAEILAKLDQQGHAQPQEQEMQSFSRRTKREAHDSRIMRLTWALGALFVGLTGIWWWQSLQMTPEAELTADPAEVQALDEAIANAGNGSSTAVLTAVTEPGSDDNASIVSTVDAEQQVQLPSIEPEPQASFEDSFTEPQEQADADVDSADSLAAEQLNEVVSEEETVVASSDLELSFTGDCWIDIRDANGRRLDTGIKKAGDVLKLDGSEPFRVVLGAPSVVTMSYKGKPVDLSRYPAGKVARLKLPQ